MNRTILLLLFTIFSIHCFAQDVNFYAKGGPNVSSLSINPGSSGLESKTAQILINLSFYTDINYGKISLQPAIQFSGKGGDYYDNNTNTLRKLRLYYVEVPLNVVLNIKAGENSIFIGGGPYLAGGMGGTLRSVEPTKRSKASLKLFKKTTDFRLGDVGAGAIVGYKFKKGIIVSANYELGFANTLTYRANSTGDIAIKNRTLGISVGYILN